MTEQPQQREHFQRCETCMHYNDETETEYGMCYAESGHREQMYNNTFDHVSRFGCASHSPRPHTPAPDDEQCRICSAAIERKATLAMLDAAILLLQTDINCMQEMRDWTQCGKCPYAIEKENGYYDCRLDKLESLRTAHEEQP